MTKNDVRFKYVGSDPFLKKLFNDESLYLMDYKDCHEGPITNDELLERFNPGPAHVTLDGKVMRFGRYIGRIGKEFLIGGAELDD